MFYHMVADVVNARAPAQFAYPRPACNSHRLFIFVGVFSRRLGGGSLDNAVPSVVLETARAFRVWLWSLLLDSRLA